MAGLGLLWPRSPSAPRLSAAALKTRGMKSCFSKYWGSLHHISSNNPEEHYHHLQREGHQPQKYPQRDCHATAAFSTTSSTISFGWSFRAPPRLFQRLQQQKWFGTTPPALMPLDEFRDPVPREKRETEMVGRPWSVKELRRKSFEDLHKLWYVLYKERNMLITEANLSRRHGQPFVQPNRQRKVKKSMAAIKVVLGERKREKLAQHALRMTELEAQRKEEASVAPRGQEEKKQLQEKKEKKETAEK